MSCTTPGLKKDEWLHLLLGVLQLLGVSLPACIVLFERVRTTFCRESVFDGSIQEVKSPCVPSFGGHGCLLVAANQCAALRGQELFFFCGCELDASHPDFRYRNIALIEEGLSASRARLNLY